MDEGNFNDCLAAAQRELEDASKDHAVVVVKRASQLNAVHPVKPQLPSWSLACAGMLQCQGSIGQCPSARSFLRCSVVKEAGVALLSELTEDGTWVEGYDCRPSLYAVLPAIVTAAEESYTARSPDEDVLVPLLHGLRRYSATCKELRQLVVDLLLLESDALQCYDTPEGQVRVGCW